MNWENIHAVVYGALIGTAIVFWVRLFAGALQ